MIRSFCYGDICNRLFKKITAGLPVYHHSADYIFSGPFGIIGLNLSQFENRVPLKPVLVGVGSTIPLVHMNRLNKSSHALFSFL